VFIGENPNLKWMITRGSPFQDISGTPILSPKMQENGSDYTFFPGTSFLKCFVLLCPFISQHTSLDGAALRLDGAAGTQPPALLWPTSGDPSRDIRAKVPKETNICQD
jgi:hypothetical protein